MGQSVCLARKHLSRNVLFVAMTSVTCGSLQAQESQNAGFEYGATVDLRYDDNIYRSDAIKTDSWITEIQPFVRGTLFRNGNTYQLEYLLDHAEYFDAGADTFTDHHLTMDINHRFTHRQAVAIKAGYKILTEERGTGFSEEPNDRVNGPDDFDHANIEARYLLGVPSAALRFELYGKHDVLDFDSSYVGDTRDYKQNQLGAIAFYRFGARTDLLLEYRRLTTRYDNVPLDFGGDPLDLDADEVYYLAGVAWELTAKTRGEVKVGQSKRDYSGEAFSTSDFHWEANLEWRPRSYSRFILKTNRLSQETYGSGLYVNTQLYELQWLHSWPGRFRTEAKIGFNDDTYEDSDRKDERMHWEAMLGYDYATWLALEAGYHYRENDSNLDLVDYTQNIFFIRGLVEF